MSTPSMPPPTYPSTPAPLACRPLSSQSLACSAYRVYAPRKSSPLAEGISTSRQSSLFLASPTASPPDSPRSPSFTDTSPTSSAPSLLCPKPTHSKSLPPRVHTVRRPSTAPFTPKSAPLPSIPHYHRRAQSTSSDPIEASPRQSSALKVPELFRPAKPSTSRVPEENWMTSESAPRFTRENIALGAVVLPVRKDDAQRFGRQSSLKSGAHVKYATMPNTAIATTPLAASTPNLGHFGFSSETLVEKKSSHKVIIPSIRRMDTDGTIQAVDEVGLDISKRDGSWKKNTAPLKHVRKLSKDLAAKMKIRTGQMKSAQEKGPDPVLTLTEKLAVDEKHHIDSHPRPSGMLPSKRTRSIWGYITGSSR